MASSGAVVEDSGSPQPACNRKTVARPKVSESCFDMTDLLVRVRGSLLLDDSREHDPRQVHGSPWRAADPHEIPGGGLDFNRDLYRAFHTGAHISAHRAVGRTRSTPARATAEANV